MTSGEFHSTPLTSITIDRASRNRRELSADATSALADSIRRLGLIHPIVITREGALVAGETRLEACRALGWSSIPSQYVDEVEPKLLRAIELEENIKRNALPWQDECRAIHEFHILHRDEGWTISMSAEALGMSETPFKERLAVARELLAENPRVLAAPKMSTARGIVKRVDERAAQDEAALLADAPVPQIDSVLVEDFNEWAPRYMGSPFNLLHCDFPYGINISDVSTYGQANIHGRYDDSPATYFRLINTLVMNKERLLGASAHVIFWFSMQHYTQTYDLLSQVFYVDPYPLIWHKSDNKGTYLGYERRARRIYETAFFCSLGDRKIISQVSNLVSANTVRDLHMSAKPIEVLSHYFRMVADGNTRLLDPTCGSGSALVAAEAAGAAYVLGLEINPEFAETARSQLVNRRKSNGA